jgi:protein SCO1/2
LVFPETDSVLLTYAKKNQVNDAKWNLVTGDKKIYMARKSYLAVKLGQGELRYGAYRKFCFGRHQKKSSWLYDGTNKEDIKRLIEDITF